MTSGAVGEPAFGAADAETGFDVAGGAARLVATSIPPGDNARGDSLDFSEETSESST